MKLKEFAIYDDIYDQWHKKPHFKDFLEIIGEFELGDVDEHLQQSHDNCLDELVKRNDLLNKAMAECNEYKREIKQLQINIAVLKNTDQAGIRFTKDELKMLRASLYHSLKAGEINSDLDLAFTAGAKIVKKLGEIE